MDPIAAIVQPARHPQYGTVKRARTRPAKRADKVPHDQRALLRVKHLSLGKEAGIIRQAEAATDSLQLYMVHHRHRVEDVRVEARACGLALAFLTDRGLLVGGKQDSAGKQARRLYAHIERSRKAEREAEFQVKVLPRIVYHAARFGTQFNNRGPRLSEETVAIAVGAWLSGEPYDHSLVGQPV